MDRGITMNEETAGVDLGGLVAGIAAELDAAVLLRHEIHRDPHVSGDEWPTAEAVIAALGGPAVERVAGSGFVVRVGPDGPAIGIRAELDALPIEEQSGVGFASTNGRMHACGHDVHLAGAVAVARAAMRIALPVAILFIFQPREESYPSGARDVLESGVLERHDVRSVIGVHVHPNVPAGSITTGSGVVNAASDEFRLVVEGRGGHAAYPHKTTDTIVALAQIISAAQTIVSRRVDPMHPAVLSFGRLRSGDAANVIPERSTAAGSIRSTAQEDRAMIAGELGTIAKLVAQSNGCTARVEITSGEPVLRNDHRLVEFVDPELRAQGFDVVEPMRSCGSDDFSFYSAVYPSLMMFLGTDTGDQREGLSLHSPDFCPADDSVAAVARVFASAYRAAVEHLGALAEAAEDAPEPVVAVHGR